MGKHSTLRTFASLVWANSDPVNTEKVAEIELGGRGPAQTYTISVHNPSGVTGLQVDVYSRENFVADENNDPADLKDVLLTSFTVAASETKQVVVEGWLGSYGGKLKVENTTALGAADGFTAEIVVRRV